jgi:hypothetical protein
MTHIADHYGEYLMASVIIADITSLIWYLVGLIWELNPSTGKMQFIKTTNPDHLPTGNVIYDFFMGTILYPRFRALLFILSINNPLKS